MSHSDNDKMNWGFAKSSWFVERTLRSFVFNFIADAVFCYHWNVVYIYLFCLFFGGQLIEFRFCDENRPFLRHFPNYFRIAFQYECSLIPVGNLHETTVYLNSAIQLLGNTIALGKTGYQYFDLLTTERS